MNERREFRPIQAEEVAQAFAEHGVDYLFIGKSGAILLGYPGTTQDVDIFPERSPENGRRIVAALRSIGFGLNPDLERDILSAKDFVQVKDGPFDVDLIFAPDGIRSYREAKERGLNVGIFHVANLRDIIASKRSSGRQKDLVDLALLESFRAEYEKRNSQPLQTAADLAGKKQAGRRETQ